MTRREICVKRKFFAPHQLSKLKFFPLKSWGFILDLFQRWDLSCLAWWWPVGIFESRWHQIETIFRSEVWKRYVTKSLDTSCSSCNGLEAKKSCGKYCLSKHGNANKTIHFGIQLQKQQVLNIPLTTGNFPSIFFTKTRLEILLYFSWCFCRREARKSQSNFPDHRGLNKPRGQTASHELMVDGFFWHVAKDGYNILVV